MSVYVIVSYDINDHETYGPYVPGVQPILQRHGAELLVATYDATKMEGEPHGCHVILRFPSEENAMAWFNDPEYAPLKKLRHSTCSNNHMVLAPEFVFPS